MGTDLFGTIPSGLELIEQAVREYQPSHLFAMFSGGHDSLCATHIAAQHPAFSAVVHINTGIGIEDTRQYVRDTCKRFGWPLIEYHAKEDCGQDYDELVLERGFPGPAHHTKMFNRLKQRCLEKMTRDYKTHRRDRILCASGMRASESVRRMSNAKPLSREGHTARVWVGPIHDWSSDDKASYMEKHRLPENQVVKLLCKSGECLCGAFAKPGELDEIAVWYPDVAARIRGLEARVKERGRHCVWGERPPRSYQSDDQTLPLCWSCEAKAEQR